MYKTRRQFITDTSKVIAASGMAGVLPASSLALNKKTSAADKINVGLIGAKGQGFEDLKQALKQPGVVCTAVCDVDETVLAQRAGDVEKIQGQKPASYKDYRKLLQQKDINAVLIGTPDHWHCLLLLAAIDAGKDVYVEKPLANSIGEADRMVAAVRKTNRIVQVGQQQRSGDHWKTAINLIQENKLGKLRKIQVWANFDYGVGQPKEPDEPVPAGVDFDMWLGPAPMRSFNKTRFHGSWRMFWDYGGGLMTDWGVHLMDMALWATKASAMPLSVAAAGGNFAFPDRAHETFDTLSVVYQMPAHTIVWENTAGIETGPWGRNYGLAFICDDATLVIDRSSWELFPEMTDGKYKIPAIPRQTGHDSHEAHVRNWIDCIRSRQEPACPIEMGRLAAVYCHMGNIALRTHSMLNWDQSAGNFGANTAANALITPSYRKPWVLPKL